jgi:hypothetical protein
MTHDQQLFLLIAEFTEAENHTKRVELASKIVDFDGEDSADMTDMEIIAAAKRIVARQIEKLEKLAP